MDQTPVRQRPRHHSAEARNELAPLHSIASSAQASNVGGTSRPSVFAGCFIVNADVRRRGRVKPSSDREHVLMKTSPQKLCQAARLSRAPTETSHPMSKFV